MKKLAVALALSGLGCIPAAHATNGYFQPGFSVKSVGMGGVGIAFPQDAMAAAMNPAGMVDVGNRLDFGLTVFQPKRNVSLSSDAKFSPLGPTGPSFPIGGSYGGNDQKDFLIPEFGLNYMLNPTMSVGVSVYGNGGLNTGYSKIFPPFQPGTGVDLQQLFVAPTFAMKINPSNSIGVSLNIVHQSFRANGLANLCNAPVPGAPAGFTLSANPAACTDNGHSDSNGVGVRIGWIGQLTPTLAVGATYQSETHMQGFDKYSGLFAGGGKFNIPANYGVGLAWKATPALTVAADVVRIDYGSIPAIANGMLPGQLGGQTNGPGFSWKSINVYKLGVAYQVNDALTVRAGWNHGDNPIGTDNVLFNTLAPGVVKDHLTLGATYAVAKNMEVSFDYVHAFGHSVTGPLPMNFGFTGSETLSMSQNVLGVSLGWKY
ncbi:MAG: OmpP1/FadL family transporter [Thiomonas sp.]